MKKKVILSAFMALIMMLSILPMSAFATYDNPTIDADTKTITIKSADDLAWLSTYTGNIDDLPDTFQGWTIAIVNDINLDNRVWTPIPDFHGTMRGVPADGSTNNYVTITGLNVNVTDSAAGLCAGGGGAKFENLMITESNITTTAAYAGAFIGNGFTSSFENCHTFNTSVYGDRFVGGIAGFAYGNFTNCTVMANDGDTLISAKQNASVLSSSGDNAGGIVGQVGEGGLTLSKCKVSGITVKASRQVGGIAGLVMYGNEITECTVSDTTVQATVASTTLGELIQRVPAAGGLVGQLQPSDYSPITFSKNTVEDSVSVYGVTPATTQFCGWLIGDTRNATAEELIVEDDNTYPQTGIGPIG